MPPSSNLKSDIYNHINNPIDVDAAMEKSTFSSAATVFQLHILKQLSHLQNGSVCTKAGQFSSSVYRQQEHYISH